MKRNWNRGAATLSSLALMLALGACGERVENTEMSLAEQSSVEINRYGMDGAKPAEAANGVANPTATMGAAAPEQIAVANDPDDRIAEDVKMALTTNADFGAVKVDVHSDDGVVTLRGRALDPNAKDRATEIARGVRDVKSVENQLTLG